MKELGILTKIEGRDAVAGITMGEGCSHCRSKGECSVVGAEIQVRLAEGFSPAVGDMVSIELPGGVQALALAWIVALPLGLFIAGYLIGRVVAPDGGEGPAALFGLGGIALGLLAAAFGTRRGRLGRRPIAYPCS